MSRTPGKDKMGKIPLSFSVVICTYNPGPKLRESAESILNQDHTGPVQLVIVDDGSTEDIFRHLKGLNYTGIRLKKNRGLATARNAGIKASTGDIICFTDDDCIADMGWIRNLAGYYGEHPEVNGVGGKIVPYSLETVLEKYSEYSKNPMYSHTRKMASGSRIRNYLRNFFGTRRRPLKDGESVDSIMGASSSYRREILEKVGGCDENFRRGVDWELNIRLKQAGGNFIYCERAVMVHKHRSDWRQFFKHVHSYGRVYPQIVKKHPQVRYFPYPLPWLFIMLCALCPLLAIFWRWELDILGLNFPLMLGLLLVPLIYVIKEIPYGIRVYREVRSIGLVLALPWVEFIRETVYDLGSTQTIITGKGLPPPGEK